MQHIPHGMLSSFYDSLDHVCSQGRGIDFETHINHGSSLYMQAFPAVRPKLLGKSKSNKQVKARFPPLTCVRFWGSEGFFLELRLII